MLLENAQHLNSNNGSHNSTKGAMTPTVGSVVIAQPHHQHPHQVGEDSTLDQSRHARGVPAMVQRMSPCGRDSTNQQQSYSHNVDSLSRSSPSGEYNNMTVFGEGGEERFPLQQHMRSRQPLPGMVAYARLSAYVCVCACVCVCVRARARGYFPCVCVYHAQYLRTYGQS